MPNGSGSTRDKGILYEPLWQCKGIGGFGLRVSVAVSEAAAACVTNARDATTEAEFEKMRNEADFGLCGLFSRR